MNILSSSQWIDQIFDAQQVARGGIVRRKVKSVNRYASFAELMAEVKARGFHMFRSGGQYVIFCDSSGDFQVIT